MSRGLLHYYFGTKEQLLVEAVRRDCELRMELLERQLAGARTAEDFIDLMAQNLQETVREDPDFVTLVFELFTLSRRNAEIAAEYAGLMRRTREQVAGMLAAAQREGVLRLHAEPEAVAEILFSLADGFALRMLAEPDRDFTRRARRHRLRARAPGRLTGPAAPASSAAPIGRSYNRPPMPIYEYRRPDGTTFEISSRSATMR